jgi:hypothetical protein
MIPSPRPIFGVRYPGTCSLCARFFLSSIPYLETRGTAGPGGPREAMAQLQTNPAYVGRIHGCHGPKFSEYPGASGGCTGSVHRVRFCRCVLLLVVATVPPAAAPAGPGGEAARLECARDRRAGGVARISTETAAGAVRAAPSLADADPRPGIPLGETCAQARRRTRSVAAECLPLSAAHSIPGPLSVTSLAGCPQLARVGSGGRSTD